VESCEVVSGVLSTSSTVLFATSLLLSRGVFGLVPASLMLVHVTYLWVPF